MNKYRNKERLRKIEYLKLFPWRKALWNARQRCNNSNNRDYKYYGGKGIKMLLTAEECENIWIISKAHLLKHPSLDRINRNGHYDVQNCQFIELKDNALKARLNLSSKT